MDSTQWHGYPVFSPTIVNGIIYVGSSDHNLYAFNAKNGTLLWSASTGSSIDSSPAVANGVVYVNSEKLYAFNAKTGAALWSATTDTSSSSIPFSPTVSNGVVYVGSTASSNPFRSRLYAFQASGCGSPFCAPLWVGPTADGLISTPTVANSVIYIGIGENLYAFHLPQ